MKISKNRGSFLTQLPVSGYAMVYLVFFCVLSLGELQRVEVGNFPAFHLHDLLLAGFVGWHLLQGNWRSWCWKGVQRFPTVGWVELVWVGAGLGLSFLSGHSLSFALLALTRLTLYALSFLSLAFDLKNKKIQPSLLVTGLLLFVSFLLYFGILQYLFVPDTRILFFLGWDDHYYRLISTLLDPGFSGLIFCLGYILVSGLLFFPKIHFSPFDRKALQILCVGLAGGILLTYSRASYLAFVVSLLVLLIYFWQKQSRHFVIFHSLVLVVFLVVIPFLPRPAGEGVKLERTSTVISRITTIQANLQLLSTPSQIIFGRGLFVPTVDPSPTFYAHQPTHARIPDNWLLLIFIGTGGVGTILFLFLLFSTFRSLTQRPLFLWIGLIAVLVHGIFNASLTYSFVVLFLGSWAVLTSAYS